MKNKIELKLEGSKSWEIGKSNKKEKWMMDLLAVLKLLLVKLNQLQLPNQLIKLANSPKTTHVLQPFELDNYLEFI